MPHIDRLSTLKEPEHESADEKREKCLAAEALKVLQMEAEFIGNR
jgi:hypothetical protein